MLTALNSVLTNSINSLGFNCSEELSKFAQVRTLTPIKTTKAFSEHIPGIHRTTIVKNLQKLSEDEFYLYAQLPNLPDILDDNRFKYTTIIDSTLLRRWSEKVYGCSIRYNYIERHSKPYQEQINCCIYHEKKGIYTIYTTIKPLSKKSTDIFIEIIRFLSHINIGTVVGDTFVTTKKIMKESKELRMEYIGKLRKNIIVEYFGKKVKVEELFRKDFEKEKLKLRTINGIEFRLSAKIVNIPDVGKVKIVAVLMENQKKPKYLISTNYKKKAENIISEYMKRPKIEEKHRRDKSILEIEGNYLTSEKSNIGFVRFMAIISNCIEYLSHKYGLSFYEVIKECSKELIKKGIS